MHRMRTDPALEGRIARAEQEPLSEQQRANLREIRRDWRNANALPESLVQRGSWRVALRACLAHAAAGQRLGRFRRATGAVLALAREEAALLSQQTGLANTTR